jgi:ERCC4-type nuclease
MKIMLDERESALYSTCNTLLNNNNTDEKIQKRVLELGDILIVDDSNSETNGEEKILVMIERKTITDLLSSIKDGRYEEQSHRLQNASGMHSHNIIYILEGMFSNSIRTPQEKKIVLSAITSLNYFKGYSVIRTCSITETAEFILNMVDKIERDMKKGKTAAFSLKTDGDIQIHDREIKEEEGEIRREVETKKYCEVVKKVKKENITKENMGEIILCQIPGISSVTAIAIMKYVDNYIPKLLEILQNSPEELLLLKIGDKIEKQRKINKKNIESMIHFLL